MPRFRIFFCTKTSSWTIAGTGSKRLLLTLMISAFDMSSVVCTESEKWPFWHAFAPKTAWPSCTYARPGPRPSRSSPCYRGRRPGSIGTGTKDLGIFLALFLLAIFMAPCVPCIYCSAEGEDAGPNKHGRIMGREGVLRHKAEIERGKTCLASLRYVYELRDQL